MRTWEVKLGLEDGLRKVNLTGPRGQTFEIRCSFKDGKVFGLDFDFDSDTLLGEIYRTYVDEFKNPVSPSPVLDWELEKTDPDLEETCYDYSRCFESLIEARDDYLNLVNALEEVYERYEHVSVSAGVEAYSYTFLKPDRSKCTVDNEQLVKGFFTDICKDDEFWDFVEALEMAYNKLWKGSN